MPKQVKANINIGAKASGFAKVGSQLSDLGHKVQQISDASAKMLKDSADVYRGYEDNMLTVRAVLNGTSKSATQVTRQMESLDRAAQQWAASTIFNTSDVSAAMVDAARAGWDYEKIMSGIPNVMNMAQAAGMSLSEAMAYFVPIMNATGTSFSDGSLLIDRWVQAANNAPTTVSELGEAIKNLGAMSQLFGNQTEMFTFLDMLAQNGVVGTQAGTVLRNMIARLYAPTKKAADAMEDLDMSVEDLFEDGESLDSAEKALNELGLSAYDSQGKMRPMLDIFMDMSKLMRGKSQEDINNFMKTVFGTKQFAGALTLLKEVQGGYDGLYSSIEEASGSAEKAGQIMTSGLTGSIMALESKWEEFQLQIGEKFAPTIEGATAMLGGVIDGLNNLDDGQLAAITGGLTALAGLAPALLAGGGLIKMVQKLGPAGTALVVAAAGAGALVGYMAEMDRLYKESAFGDVTLDADTINKYLDNQKTVYSVIEKAMAGSEAGIAESAEKVEETISGLNEKMYTYVIGQAKLNPTQIAELESLGSDIVTNVQNGIQSARISSTTFFGSIFGDDSMEVGMISSYYDYLSGEAYSIGEQLRSQMVAALQDGSINGEEQKAIQATVQRLAAIEAEIQNQMDSAEYYTLMRQAQGISYESAGEFLGGLNTKQAEELANINALYDRQYGVLRAAYDYAQENGTNFFYNGQMMSANDITWDELERRFNESQERARTSTREKYADAQMQAISALMRSGQYDFSNISAGDLYKEIANYTDAGKNAMALFDYVSDFITSQGGWDEAYHLMAIMRGQGRTDSADQMLGMLNFYREYTAAKYAMLGTGGDPMLQDYAVNELNNRKVNVGYDTSFAETAIAQSAEAMQNEMDSHPIHVTFDSWNGFTTGDGSEIGRPRFIIGFFAEGGRADAASIFGEAGPEWAIPEEHSTRTADLLTSAAAASGFTWGELLSRNGGLNAGGGANLTLTYAPTVNAGDASGVESVLQNDKKTLKKIVQEMLEDWNIGSVSGAYV